MLARFDAGLRKWEKALCEALWQDLHKSYEEAFMTELGLVYGEIADARRHLGRWARRRRVKTPVTVFPSRSYIHREPLGCTLIVSPWNYPVQLLLSPLVGAVSAGCTAILKPSPYVPAVSLALQQFVEDTFPEEYVALVQGNRTVNAELFSPPLRRALPVYAVPVLPADSPSALSGPFIRSARRGARGGRRRSRRARRRGWCRGPGGWPSASCPFRSSWR